MTNKPMLSVDRELLERIAKPLKVLADKPYRTKAILELRALLDTKTHPIIKCLQENGELIALRATVAQQAKLIEYLSGNAQHQGELAAPFKPDTVVCRRYTLEGHIFYHYYLEPVYRSVPVTVSQLINEASVALVMPERRDTSLVATGGRYWKGNYDGYNRALDDVARLNGVKQ